MKDLSERAAWPEASRGKIEEYVNAFDTVNRYGSEDEKNKPSEKEVDKAMQIIAGSEQFLSSDPVTAALYTSACRTERENTETIRADVFTG